jgi:shikimate kinase
LEGRAFCHGAATIINGIALGKGAAYGIGLKTTAAVNLTEKPGSFSVKISGDETENTQLAEYCVQRVLKRYKLDSVYGAEITTESDIPISRGLKSSSAASNAVTLAAYSALKKEFSDMDIINIGIEASIKAGVTITGAYDDACATYFGDVVVTDNLERRIMAQYSIDTDYDVIIYVPATKIRKKDVPVEQLQQIKTELEKAHDMALIGDFLKAIQLNGRAYGRAMGLDTGIADRAIDAGAVTAGISGTGPATVILTEPEKRDDVLSVLDSGEEIILTKLNSERAGLI